MEEGLHLLHQVINQVSPLGEEAWNEFQSIWRPLPLEQGAYFVEEGQRPKRMGFVVSGTLRAFYRTNDGEEYNKTFFTEGNFVAALTGLVRGAPSYINLQALEETRIIVSDYSALTALYDKYHALERVGRIAIQEEWVKKEYRELRLVLCSAEERYTYFKEDHPGLENRIAQYHIASYLGITPVALSRIRGRIARDGASDRQHIPI